MRAEPIAFTHTNSPAPEITAPEAARAQVAEQTPESKKAGVLSQTAKTANRFAQVLGLTAALSVGTPAMATESPYEPLADASGKTMLVVKEDVKGKEELFVAFDKIIQSEQTRERKKNEFNKLSSEYQKKLITYYQAGKTEQPNEKILLRGVNGLMSLYENIEVAKQGIADFSEGKQPSQDPLAFEPMVKIIIGAFPS